ncbi:MAG TPA: hypothetical protein VEY50_00155 [Lysobacter sp.]|nr:hypothetical protein [Lysobacter sp.]
MSDVKKDHSIGAGTGAVTGAVAGAAIGSAAGPAGSLVGAIAGGIVGAKAGDSIAEAINPTDYEGHFEKNFRNASYYRSDYDWNDYAPAYRYGYSTFGRYRGRDFDEIDDELGSEWERNRGGSRLAWSDARHAVRDGWHHIERALPGDFDRDGR